MAVPQAAVFAINMGLGAMDNAADARALSSSADALEKNARIALVEGEFKEEDFRNEALRFSGTQTAALAANGVDVTGSQALDFMADQMFQAERQALNIRLGAELEADVLRTEAASVRQQAKRARRLGGLKGVLSFGAAAKSLFD
jgi:hypothetical protein